MSLFHQHNWKEVERFYAEPTAFKLTNVSEELAENLLLGKTIILYKCEDYSMVKDFKERKDLFYRGCGKTRTETILGKKI